MRRLLLVDGNRTDCGRLARVLSGLGYGLDVTFNAEEARMLNERQSYSWSVIGTPLDGVDGVELFTEIRERQQRIRGLLVADRPNGRVQTAARKAGLDVVVRPVDINVLIPWLSRTESLPQEFVESPARPGELPSVDEAYVRALEEASIRERLTSSELIRIIRGVDYPFAGKDRLEMFDRDTLVRVALLVRRWCLNRR